MVTKNIKANTATQVNSNLIGVLVNPNTNPPIVTVDDIVVDYTYTTFVVSNVVPDPEIPDTYTLSLTGTDNNVYVFTNEVTSINDEGYNKLKLWEQDDIIWIKQPSGRPGEIVGSSLFNIDFTDGENPVITDSGIKVGTLFLGIEEGRGENKDIPFIQNAPNDLYNSSYSSTYQVDGDFLIDVQSGYKVGYVMSGPTVVTDQNVKFTKGGMSGVYYYWMNDDLLSSGFSTRYLYTTTDSPAVGDSALFTSVQGQEDYNVQTIKAIDTTETPAPEVPIDCTLSYSVDGETWTDWPENMTDDNNVISNIPRYMYLMFSQDVVITEE